jgi:homoserine O-acetyltransferase
MVNSQYRLVRDVLGIDTLHAVVGISMGGHQTFEWMVAYPSMMRKAIPMVGTPRPSSFDLLLWGTVLDVIGQCHRAGCENTGGLAWKIANLGLVTPQERMATITQDGFGEFISDLEEQARSTFIAEDAMTHVRAVIDHDISNSFGSSMERAGESVTADALIVVATYDNNVRPEPALEFARLIGAEVYQSDGPCGHMIPTCEMESIGRRIATFLAH